MFQEKEKENPKEVGKGPKSFENNIIPEKNEPG